MHHGCLGPSDFLRRRRFRRRDCSVGARSIAMGPSAEEYGRRFGTFYGVAAFRQSVLFAGTSLLHEDPRPLSFATPWIRPAHGGCSQTCNAITCPHNRQDLMRPSVIPRFTTQRSIRCPTEWPLHHRLLETQDRHVSGLNSSLASPIAQLRD